MDVTLPIYVEACKHQGATLCYRCRPLFQNEPYTLDENLRRATNKLARELKSHLDQLGRMALHHPLSNFIFAPDVKTHRLKLKLDLRDRIAKCTLLFARITVLDREVAFTPAIPELWFELRPDESLEARATETLVKHFRDSRHNGPMTSPEELSLRGEAWIANLELDVGTRQPTRAEEDRRHTALWDNQQVDGATELQRVGRCLDWLYPDELDRAVGRTREVEELDRLLGSRDRRPVMLVGPPMAGKTTILHETVFRRVLRRRTPQATKRNVWLIAPQRLIAGMSFVEQWEHRLLAILDHARKRRHVLYFDDLLGLYQAGQSRSSSLAVADVLKPYVQDRNVRVLGEMTAEAFHALAERDRGFADLFHVIRVEETNDDQTLRTLLAVRRQLEAQYRCSFDIEVLPAVIELHRRYLREFKFPGKAARFLRQLAIKHRRGEVTRHTVYEEFSAKTGLAVALLDTRERLKREDVLTALRKKIIS